MGVGGLFEIKAYTASQLELELELAKTDATSSHLFLPYNLNFSSKERSSIFGVPTLCISNIGTVLAFKRQKGIMERLSLCLK